MYYYVVPRPTPPISTFLCMDVCEWDTGTSSEDWPRRLAVKLNGQQSAQDQASYQAINPPLSLPPALSLSLSLSLYLSPLSLLMLPIDIFSTCARATGTRQLAFVKLLTELRLNQVNILKIALLVEMVTEIFISVWSWSGRDYCISIASYNRHKMDQR